MTDTSDDRHPVEILAEEYVARRRAGESPNLTEYVEQYPDWADEIRDIFPTMLMMERLKPHEDELEPAEEPPLQVEQLGDFRIIREVGRGGMGVVYEAVQESLGRRVALKILSGRSLNNERRLKRFAREARTAAKLHHTNIVPVFGAGEQDGMHYLVMQFISGQGLDEVLRALRHDHGQAEIQHIETADKTAADASAASSQGPVSAALLAHTLLNTHSDSLIAPTITDSVSSQSAARELPAAEGQESREPDSERSEADQSSARTAAPAPAPGNLSGMVDRSGREIGIRYWRNVAQIGTQIADALQYAHSQGTLHRDIKPANLLMDTHGSVWVADFGLAKLMIEDDLTNSGDVVGTLAYMAPEQFSGKVDHRSDIYSLGLTLYELVTLKQAYDERDRTRLIRQVTQHDPPAPRKIRPGIPRDLETIIQKAITREPAARYQSAQELGNDLRRFLTDVPILARRISHAERLWRWCRRNRAVASLSGLAITLLLLVAVVASIGNFRLRRAYNETAEALERESRQLQITEEERARAEVTLDIALLVLDNVFEQAAPPAGVVSDLSNELDEPLLEPQFEPVVSEQNAALLQNLLRFYDQFTEQDRATLQVRLKSGQAHRRVGEIQTRLGQHASAETAFRQSVDVLRKLVSEHPDEPQYRRELAESLNGLGNVMRNQRQFDRSIKNYREAIALFSTLALEVSNPQHWDDLYRSVLTLNRLGNVQAMSWDANGAEATFRRALGKLENLTDHAPNYPDYRHAESEVRRSLARLLFFTRRGEEGRQMYEQSLSMLESLVDQYPNSPRYSYDLIDTYSSSRTRSVDEAQRAHRVRQLNRAIDLARGLVDRYPQIPEYEMLLSRSLLRLGQLRSSEGNPTAAARSFRESLSILKSLNYRFPSVTMYYMSIARTGHELGRALCESGDLAEARTVQEDVVENQQVFLKADPDSRYARFWLSRHYRALSETLALLGESTLAEDAYRRSEEFRDSSDRNRNSSSAPDSTDSSR